VVSSLEVGPDAQPASCATVLTGVLSCVLQDLPSLHVQAREYVHTDGRCA
jgi:hypothetical protein